MGFFLTLSHERIFLYCALFLRATLERLLRIATESGGAAFGHNATQNARDERPRSHFLPPPEIQEGWIRNLTEERKKWDQTILSEQSPVTRSFESMGQHSRLQNSTSTVPQPQTRLPTRARIAQAVQTYQSERSGWSTVIKNGLGGGLGYDSPTRTLEKTQHARNSTERK